MWFGETAEDNIGSDKVDKDEATLLSCLTVALIVSLLESQLCPVKMIVCEMIAAKVVQKASPLGSRVERKRRRLLVDQGEYLFSASELPAVEEQFQANVGHEVDTNPSTLWLAVIVETG